MCIRDRLQGGTPIGAPLVGWIATEFGARWSLGIGAVVAIAAGLVALMVLNRRTDMHMRDHLRHLRPRAVVQAMRG